jgi:hypothetical protein
MGQQNNDGFDDNFNESIITDETVSDSSTDDNASEDISNEDSGSHESDFDALVEQLKDNGVPLNKIQRFQELNKKAKDKETEAETLRKELETLRSSAKDQPTQNGQQQQTQQTATTSSADDDLFTTLDSLELPTLDEIETDQQGNYVKGGYKTYADMFKAFQRGIFANMMKVREITEEKKKAQEAEAQQHYATLEKDVQEAFTDDQGTLDQQAYDAYMKKLREDHEKTPVDNTRKHLINYLKSSLRSQTQKPQENENERNARKMAGRTLNSGNGADDYIPGQTSWDNI